jgi:hypothetical protein
VTHYVVDIHHHTHTCPNGQQPHPVDTRRTIVSHEPGGPCTRPKTIHSGDQAVRVACGRAVPAAQQCPACRVTVTVRHTTTTDLGPIARNLPIPPAGPSRDHPCPVCGGLGCDLFEDTDGYLLCRPIQQPRP